MLSGTRPQLRPCRVRLFSCSLGRSSSSHRGPAAADEEFVDVLVEDEPEPVPMTPSPCASGLEDLGTGAGS